MRTILFYGDSNTWGYNAYTGERYPRDVRFTGLLAERLPEYFIVEEALNGRTTVTDDNLGPNRNGYDTLPMVMYSQSPVDLLVVMLGTNDTKSRFRNSESDIGHGMEMIINVAQTPWIWHGQKAPAILLVCPPAVTEDIADSDMEGEFSDYSVQVSKKLPNQYRTIAESHGCGFLNAADVTGPGKKDGVHLDPEGHRKMADALEKCIREMMESDESKD